MYTIIINAELGKCQLLFINVILSYFTAILAYPSRTQVILMATSRVSQIYRHRNIVVPFLHARAWVQLLTSPPSRVATAAAAFPSSFTVSTIWHYDCLFVYLRLNIVLICYDEHNNIIIHIMYLNNTSHTYYSAVATVIFMMYFLELHKYKINNYPSNVWLGP
jgi:hypothetical protein